MCCGWKGIEKWKRKYKHMSRSGKSYSLHKDILCTSMRFFFYKYVMTLTSTIESQNLTTFSQILKGVKNIPSMFGCVNKKIFRIDKASIIGLNGRIHVLSTLNIMNCFLT